MTGKYLITSTDGAVKIFAIEHYTANSVPVYVIVEDHSSIHIGNYLIPSTPGEFQFYRTELGTAINKRCVDNSPWLVVTKLPEVKECSAIHRKGKQ